MEESLKSKFISGSLTIERTGFLMAAVNHPFVTSV
jgi:hypothetical protein